MSISGIKIYGKDGELKKEISPEDALKIYDEKNKATWSLSDNERRIWERYIIGVTLKDDPEPTEETYPTSQAVKLKKNYPSDRDIHYRKIEPKYSIICKGCSKAVKMKSVRAKFCTTECRLASLRKTNKRW